MHGIAGAAAAHGVRTLDNMGNRMLCSANMCPKATLQPTAENELFDDSSACDPAGTVFNQTLEDLNEMDRLLLVFASSANLSAVRWLFAMGANRDACDTNGTTCLHAACRSGSVAIVREFIRRELPLNASDIAGWTALHVALFMGRRSVAIELMHRGADLGVRNSRGLVPSDLCSDMWLREAVRSCSAHRHSYGLQRAWDFGRDNEIGEDIQISSNLRFEPFFCSTGSCSQGPSEQWRLAADWGRYFQSASWAGSCISGRRWGRSRLSS